MMAAHLVVDVGPVPGIRVERAAGSRGAARTGPACRSGASSIRVKPGERFLFVVFACPFASYYPAALDVLATGRYVRAFPGGTGDTKPAGNYAPTFLAEEGGPRERLPDGALVGRSRAPLPGRMRRDERLRGAGRPRRHA